MNRDAGRPGGIEAETPVRPARRVLAGAAGKRLISGPSAQNLGDCRQLPRRPAPSIILRLNRAPCVHPQTDEPCVHDPLSAGRRLALRAVAWQAGATALAALAFLALGVPSALGALVGGGAVVAGSLASAFVALGGGIQPAATAIGRLLAGIALKWGVVLVALVLGLAGWALPPLPMVVGLVVATLAFVPAHISKG